MKSQEPSDETPGPQHSLCPERKMSPTSFCLQKWLLPREPEPSMKGWYATFQAKWRKVNRSRLPKGAPFLQERRKSHPSVGAGTQALGLAAKVTGLWVHLPHSSYLADKGYSLRMLFSHNSPWLRPEAHSSCLNQVGVKREASHVYPSFGRLAPLTADSPLRGWLLQAPDSHQEIIFLCLSRAVRMNVLTGWDLEAHNGIRVNTLKTPC